MPAAHPAVYLDPKWAWQRLRLYGAQDRALEQFFKKLEKEMVELSMKRHGCAKQLVVFFGAASIGTRGAYVRRLEAACQLLHEGPQATGAQPASFGPAAHKVSPAASTTPSAGASTSAERLSTLLLTDQDVLDVVLALHGIRAAQLCHLMPWPGSHPLKLPPPGKALAKQLSQSQRSVPGSQLLAFVKTLERDSSLKVLGLVWGIENTLQHPDPAATTHTSSTTQLPPGYHRCSACLLLSLRLVLSVAQHCVEQPLDKDLALARLYATLPGLLLGLSTTLTVMEAAGHPEAQAQRVQFGVVKLTVLMPDWRRRPAVLRTGLRVATAGALAHNTMLSLLLSTEQLAPLALDLVLGMENTLQV
ncbi:hypothetical protein HaLaN_00779 [Haematococcus lacustris]|uniref:Uncharacterized protein n=1 Tax=Haematococcus lacustris TaxID=44745 RepID=A0A699YJR1_HAELA|nr:hypothetical protein HaLaN_00779 [Haematococcus lacustris]